METRSTDVLPAPDPMIEAAALLVRATDLENTDPTRFALSTVGLDGSPSVRFLLLKSIDDRGFGFVTNWNSRKGRELAREPRAALALHWAMLDVQVRAEGPVHRADDATSDAYFATRPRESQLGAWASQQSEVLTDRAELESRLEALRSRYEGTAIPRPGHWGYGFLVPSRIELWYGRPSRLHDRFAYVRDGSGFRVERLSP